MSNSNIRMSHILMVLYLLFVGRSLFAAEKFEFYKGARQMAMGGAYTATVNDETALLSNPAGLGRLRDYIVTLADPEVEVGSETTKVFTLSNYAQALQVQGLLDTLNANKGSYFHGKAQVFPSIVVPNFGTGLHVKYQADAEVDTAGTNFRLDYRNDWVVPLGFDFRLAGGIIKLGVVARMMDRVEVAKDISPASTGLTLNTLASDGVGIAADVGLTLAAPVLLLPTLSAVVHDVGGTTYNLSSGIFYATSNRPLATDQSVDVGLAFFPIIGKRGRAAIIFEAHDVTTISQETDSMKRYHAGVEFNIADFFFLRGGMNQRYWTAGFEFATERFQLQGTTYGEEIGTATANREDRRWVGKFSIRF